MFLNFCTVIWETWQRLPWGGWVPPEPRECGRANR